jgi:gluconolactonase
MVFGRSGCSPVAALFATVLGAVAGRAAGASSIVRLDPALDKLVSNDASVEQVLTGSPGDAFEGPNWVREPKPGYLLFTNVPGNVIYKWTPDGRLSVFLDHIFTGDPATAYRAGTRIMVGANGATLDRQGRLVYASYSAGQIVRLERDGERRVLASQFEGKRINAPNDLVVKSNGVIYFTDSRASFVEATGPDCGQFWLICGNKDGIQHKGVYFVKDGTVHLFSQGVDHPNGLAFSPDEKYLYIANTLLKNILRFRMKSDGSGGNEEVFVDMSGDSADGAPDGLKVDVKGNVYCTGPGGIWIMSPKGQHLGTILSSEHLTNFTFGGADGKTIYLESSTALFRIPVKVAGSRAPGSRVGDVGSGSH